jgi:hypothetical protein
MATAARDESITLEKQAVMRCIDEAAKRGYYEYTMEIEYYETIQWLTERGFAIIDKGYAKIISWAPIATAKWNQHPWA